MATVVNKECKLCGAEAASTDNFCRTCGTKLSDVCSCWIKKEPHSCGHARCPEPGTDEFLKLILKDLPVTLVKPCTYELTEEMQDKKEKQRYFVALAVSLMALTGSCVSLLLTILC